MSQRARSSAQVTVRLIVVDTSYLLELFRVPGCSDSDAFASVFNKFEQTDGVNAQLFVPLPVLFELGNRIADVKDGSTRYRLVGELVEAVRVWLSGESAFTIVSSMDDARTVEDFCSALKGLTERFAELATDRHGLTNTAVAQEALRLKDRHPSGSVKRVLVHIWTRDQRLKALEPDREAEAFV